LEAIYNQLQQEKFPDKMQLVPSREAAEDEILLVHTQRYLDQIRTRHNWLDGDTYMNEYSYQTASHAAGGLIDLCLQLQSGVLKNGIALLRPPGHHALPDQGMGFCILNHESIAAQILLEKKLVDRIAIVDFDVHHGNGTQAVFYSDPRVLYISSHSYPFYPGTGSAAETGEGKGKDTTLNIPLSQGSGDDIFKQVYEQKVRPALLDFQPQFILINAGYDAHNDDPIGNLSISHQGFIDICLLLISTADDVCQGKIVFSLNGGYNLQALSIAVANTVKLLIAN
jgi:acetoin utilization deacetylase AcuC-like enzyme